MQQRQQEMMKNLLIDLPEDLFINNILLSKVLPIKSLMSLRRVCKYLRNLITSPAFINMHLHHTTTSHPNHQLNNQLVLIDVHSDTPPYDVFYSLKFNDGDDPCCPEVIMFDYPIKSPLIWGSCNGLLCLSTNTTKADRSDIDRACLWNPSTKEYKDLPPPLPSTEIINIPTGITAKIRTYYGFGYDRFIDDYKIIRCQGWEHPYHDDTYYGDHISHTEFQVYTLGTNTWRKIRTTADNNHLMRSFLRATHAFLNGALHWVMSTSKMTEVKIVSFDIEKEVFQEMQTPLISKEYHWCISHIQVLRGCLWVLECDVKRSYCNVWMMMDYGVKESWTKLFTIVQNEVEVLDTDMFIRPYGLLRFFENGEILIISDFFLFIYDPTNNKEARGVEFGEIGDDYFLYHSEIYIESLVSLNSGVYIENELIRAFGCINLD